MDFQNHVLQELSQNYEFLNLFYSSILLMGLYQLGSILFRFKPINKIFSEISEIKYLKLFISVNFILLIFYPLIILTNSIKFIPILSIGIFILGIFKIISKLKKKILYKKNIF